MMLVFSRMVVLPLLRLSPRHCSTMCDDGIRISVSGVIYEAPSDRPLVQLFTKRGCTLCDQAKDVLARAAMERPHTLEAVDITDPENMQYWDRYKYDIPVLSINGIYWAKHR